MCNEAPQDELPQIADVWDFNDPAGTEEKFRQLLARAESTSDASFAAELLTQIARSQGLQRRFDDAHATLDAVETDIGQAAPIVRVRYLLERGRVFNSSKRVDQARPLFVEAWESALAVGLDSLAVDAAHMVAIADSGEESVRWNEKALDLAERSEDPLAQGWKGSLLNNLGWTYHDKGDFDRALVLFERALDWRKQEGDAKTIRIARWCVGRTLRSLARPEEALAIQEALRNEHDETGGEDGYVFEELGECLLELGRAAEARTHFQRAHELLSTDPWLADNEPDRLARLSKLGS